MHFYNIKTFNVYLFRKLNNVSIVTNLQTVETDDLLSQQTQGVLVKKPIWLITPLGASYCVSCDASCDGDGGCRDGDDDGGDRDGGHDDHRHDDHGDGVHRTGLGIVPIKVYMER